MSDSQYTNREIDRMFHEIIEALKRIEDQTIKTNGRVSKLETWKETLMAKIAGVVGTITVSWVVVKEIILK